jgi:hypothetical protein
MIKEKVQYHPPRPEGSPGHSAWLPIEKNPLRRTCPNQVRGELT